MQVDKQRYFRAGDTHMLLLLIQKPPGTIANFIADLIEALHLLPVHHRTVLLDVLIKDLKGTLLY